VSVHRLAKYQTDDPFTRIPNTAINSGLSLKALGLLVFMLSKPDGWRFTERGLISQLDCGRHSLATGLGELIERGYVRRTLTVDGNMRRWVTEVYDLPCFDFPSTELPEHREIEALSNKGTEVTNKRSKKTARLTSMTPDWQPRPETQMLLKEKYRDLDHNSQVENFRDYYISKGEKRADWDASLRTWMKKASEWQKPAKGTVLSDSKFPAGSGGIYL